MSETQKGNHKRPHQNSSHPKSEHTVMKHYTHTYTRTQAFIFHRQKKTQRYCQRYFSCKQICPKTLVVTVTK